jgi:hypothetical protein
VLSFPARTLLLSSRRQRGSQTRIVKKKSEKIVATALNNASAAVELDPGATRRRPG